MSLLHIKNQIARISETSSCFALHATSLPIEVVKSNKEFSRYSTIEIITNSKSYSQIVEYKTVINELYKHKWNFDKEIQQPTKIEPAKRYKLLVMYNKLNIN